MDVVVSGEEPIPKLGAIRSACSTEKLGSSPRTMTSRQAPPRHMNGSRMDVMSSGDELISSFSSWGIASEVHHHTEGGF